MLKISTKRSTNLSLVIAFTFLALCVAAVFFMPTVINMLIDTPDNIGNRDSITSGGRIFVHIVAYFLYAFIVSADVFSILLLLRIKKGLVFTKESVAFIRYVAWSCFGICLAFALLGVYFQLALIMSFITLFLCLCLRVVKNVIDEATEIKDENDLTV